MDVLERNDRIVTGEAVQLDLRPASFATRMLSFLIDGAIELALNTALVLATVLIARYAGLDSGYVALGLILSVVAGFLGYPVLCEKLMTGRSVGRLATGTRVVRLDGGPVHMRQSLLRAVAGMLELWSTSGGLALLVSLVDRRSRRIGDLLAGTFVVQERMRAPRAVRGEVPPALAEWAGSAEVGKLPRDVAADVRAFLPRAAGLNPDSRHRMARDLLQRTVPSVQPPPPPGTDPEQFLQAVIAIRSQRDEERLRRGLEKEHALTADLRAMPFRA